MIRRLIYQVCVLLVGVSMFAGCATDRQIIGQANQFHDNIDEAVVRDQVLNDYIQSVGDRIIEVAREMHEQRYGPGSHASEDSAWMFGKDMRFHFVNSNTLNAFTTGGEHMYIYTQLFQEAQSEDELAAVMAHEYAHVYARHVHKGMNRQLGALAAAAAAGGAGYAIGGEEHGKEYAGIGAGVGLVAAQFANMGFTRKDEAEADELGFEFYVRAGWDPEKFDDFFQHMIDKGLDSGPEMLSDHPSLASRVELAKERASELPPSADQWRREPVADAAEFERLQRRSKRIGRDMPSDETLETQQELLAAMPRSCLTPAVPEDQREAQRKIARKVERAEERQQRQD